MYSKTAELRSRVVGRGWRCASSFSMVAKKLSATALSNASPFDPIETEMPASRACWPKPRATYCPGSGRRRATAIPSASATSSVRICSVIAQADDHPGERILDGGEVEPALPGAQVGDVRDPQHVRLPRPELAFDEIIGHPDTGHPDRSAALLDLHQAGDPGRPHQPLHASARDADALAEPELGLHPPRAIDATSPLMDHGDPRGQPRVAQHAIRRRPALPLMEPGLDTPSTSHITETGTLSRLLKDADISRDELRKLL
jgi:hypothetical protein